MSPTMVEVLGTLRADGTLVLKEKPNLPPGPVRVTVQTVAEQSAPHNEMISILQGIRADQKARGYVSPSKEEIDAEIEAMRQEDDERMQGIERLQEECRRSREQSPSGETS